MGNKDTHLYWKVLNYLQYSIDTTYPLENDIIDNVSLSQIDFVT